MADEKARAEAQRRREESDKKHWEEERKRQARLNVKYPDNTGATYWQSSIQYCPVTVKLADDGSVRTEKPPENARMQWTPFAFR
mmetsp:Transcript_68161/g.142420  ORF Transcript_68161/g.142420 Transcript_68161/m.142420 type:complete len:84 (-) Transcript_68161:191-442(-)